MAEWHRIITSPYTGSLEMSGSFNLQGNSTISGNVIINGTASVNNLVVNQIAYSSGSNQLGDAANDVQTLFGTVVIPTGSFTVSGSVFITGSTVALQGGSFSGSGANLFNIPASGITGLNLSQIATGSISASVSLGSGSFSIVSGSTNFLFVSSSGNIGIGTTTPETNLHLYNPANADVIATIESINARSPYLLIKHPSRRYRVGANINVASAFEIYDENASASRFIINPNGNITIGTTTDSGFKLDVNGTGRFSGNLTVSGSATNSLLVKGSGTTSATTALSIQNSAGTPSLRVFDDGTVKTGLNLFLDNTNPFNSTPPFTVLNQQNGIISLLYETQWAHYVGSTLNGGTGDTSLGLFGLGTGGGYFGGIRFFTSFDSRTPVLAMNIDANQSVGIGLTNSTSLFVAPSAKFEIQSTSKGFLPPRTNILSNISNPAQGLQTYITASATEGLYYFNSGSYQGWTRVLNNTGSQSISGSLTITNGLTNTGSFLQSGSSAYTGGTYSFLATGAGDGGIRIDTLINGYTSLNFLSNSVGLGLMSGGGLFAKVSNAAGFHVGQSPNNTFVAALAVTGHGTTTSSTFVARNSAGTNILKVVDSGLVGINTASPQATLHVNGNVIISSSLFSTVQTGSLPIGNTLIYSVLTGSNNAGFFDYFTTSGSNGRAGTVMSFWSGSQIQYTDNSTPDVGDTSNFAFSMSLAGPNAQLFASASSNSWTVKTSFRTF